MQGIPLITTIVKEKVSYIQNLKKNKKKHKYLIK